MDTTHPTYRAYFKKTNIAFIAVLGMFIGFLVSPAVLSMAMILYGVNGLWGVHPRLWPKDRYWLLGVLWILFYAASWFWSADKEMWNTSLQLKLPFLILPLAFVHTPRFSSKKLQILLLLVGLSLLSGALYSVSFLVKDPEYYIREYSYAHLLPTPCRQDHISFSLSITLYIIWVASVWPQLAGKAVKVFIAIVSLLLAVYIHILAAKSGIVAFYLFLAGWSIYLVFSKMRKLGLLLVVAIPLLLVAAMNYIPTFSIRKNYIHYSLFKWRSGDKSGNYGDNNRMMAYQLAGLSVSEHPITGVGTGDIMSEMKAQYNKHYPQVEEKDVLMPHNQFLIVAMGCGIPALVLFSIWVFAPLTWLRKNRKSFFFFITWFILLFQLCIDTALEAQMCIFVFAFYFLQQKQIMEVPEDRTDAQVIA